MIKYAAISTKILVPILAIIVFLKLYTKMKVAVHNKAPILGLFIAIIGYAIALFTLTSSMLLGYSAELIGGTIVSYTIVPILFLIYLIFNPKHSDKSNFHKNINVAMKAYLLVIVIPATLLIINYLFW